MGLVLLRFIETNYIVKGQSRSGARIEIQVYQSRLYACNQDSIMKGKIVVFTFMLGTLHTLFYLMSTTLIFPHMVAS